MPIHVPSSQLPELYLPDWSKIRANQAQENALNSETAYRKQKAQSEQAKQNALMQYGQTGDTNALMQVDPATAISLSREDRQNKLAEATLAQKQRESQFAIFGLVSSSLATANPQNFDALRQKIVSIAPGMDDTMPRSWDELVANQQAVKESMLTWYEKLNQDLAIKKGQAELGKPQFNQYQQGDQTVTEKWTPGSGSQIVGSGPKWDQNKTGLETTLPDGTIIRYGGSKATGTMDTGLTKPTQTKVEEGLLNATSQLMRTKQMQSRFKPEYQTYSGQAEAAWSKVKEKAGADLDPEKQQFLSDFTAWRAESGQTMAETLKEMSGTAVTEQEMKRQERYLVNPGSSVFDGDSPTQVQSKLDRFVEFQTRAIARLNYVRKNGMSIQNIPLEKMDDIIRDRGNNLAGSGMDAETVKKTLAAEFGLVY